MIILFHVIIALLSIVSSTVSIVRPSRRILSADYVLIAATVASGTYLIVSSPAHLVQACITGISYLVIASALTVVAHVRLVRTATN